MKKLRFDGEDSRLKDDKKKHPKKQKPTRKFWAIYGIIFFVGAIILYLLGWVL